MDRTKEVGKTTVRLNESLTIDSLTPEQRERFLAWKAKKTNPFFETTSSVYGSIPRGVERQLKKPEFGNKKAFSATFTGDFSAKNSAMNTSISRPRYIDY